jgi:Protein of unknown function (DUF3455)
MKCRKSRAVSCAATLAACVALASPALSQTPVATPPASFDVAGRATLLTAHGVGAQIYECKPSPTGGNVWTFREPVASLIAEGLTIGRHYAGPTWDLAQGGSVRGKQAATVPGAMAADIPLLKLEVIEHHGDGPLNAATLVLRLNTKGGVLSGACDRAGELRPVPYSADYLFLR